MNNFQYALILLAISLFLFIVSHRISRNEIKKHGIKKHHIIAFIGIALMAFGLYELPWGAMEVYQLTQSLFHFNLLENYIFWSVLSLSCILIGYMIYRRSRK